MSKFQLIVLSIFTVFIIAGVIAFATFKGSESSDKLPAITIWGTFPKSAFDAHLSTVNNSLSQTISVTYTQFDESTFSRDFISALARGQGPDAILIPTEFLMTHEDKVTPIPYNAFSRRDFMDSFVAQASIYLRDEGIVGVPFTIDPLVMFWNRDLFDSAGIASFPKHWDEFVNLNKKLTVKDANGTIRKSAISMGEFSNVLNAREILATLFFQFGNPITVKDQYGDVVSTLKMSDTANPSQALNFFAQAANPSSPYYSWNKSMADTKTSFLSGILATYFGFASEIANLRQRNPNLNFDVSLVPQFRDGGVRASYARMYGFSIIRSSPVQGPTYQIISLLTNPSALRSLSETMYLPSVRRDLMTGSDADPYITIFNEAALISKSWLDADPAESRRLFANMVAEVTSGQSTPSQAMQNMTDQYDIILKQAVQ